MDPIEVAQAVYYAFCSVVSAVGVALIYWTNKKTVYKNKNVGTKWYWYTVHVIALSLVSLSQLVFSFEKDAGYGNMLFNSTYSVTLCLICVIVWQ